MFDLCFECEKPILEEALQAAARAVSPKSPLPILSHVLIEAKDGWLSVTATDLDMGITLRVPASITGEGSVACPARLMLDIVSKFPAAPITVEVIQEGRLKLKCGRSKFEITSLPASEYPSLPERKDVTELKIPHRDLKAGNTFEAASLSAALHSLWVTPCWHPSSWLPSLRRRAASSTPAPASTGFRGLPSACQQKPRHEGLPANLRGPTGSGVATP